MSRARSIAAPPPTAWLLVVEAIGAVAGGYIAAALDGDQPLVSAAAFGILLTTLGVLPVVFGPALLPEAHLTLLSFAPVFTVSGALLRMHLAREPGPLV